MKTFLGSVLAAAALLAPSLAMASTWVTDPASTRVSFMVTHLGTSTVLGRFGKVSATVNVDDKDVTRSTAEAIIETASIDTGIAVRDRALRSPDFFDVAKYPTITFKFKKVEKAGPGKLKVTGDLTMHGVTKEVVLDVTGLSAEQKDPSKPNIVRRSALATTQLNRKDFGLRWNAAVEASTGVSDEVRIALELVLVRDTTAPAAKPAK